MPEIKSPHLLGVQFRTARIHERDNSSRAAAKSDKRATGLRRWLYLSSGLTFVGLAVLGAVLPILPTTPFLILASSCFVRSSPTWQARLMRMPVWGPMLRDWELHRAVRPRAKRIALVLIPSVVVTSAIVGQLPWSLLVCLFGLATVGLIAVWRLPVILIETRTPHETVLTRNNSWDRVGTSLHRTRCRKCAHVSSLAGVWLSKHR